MVKQELHRRDLARKQKRTTRYTVGDQQRAAVTSRVTKKPN
jgi:hypothetical protein